MWGLRFVVLVGFLLLFLPRTCSYTTSPLSRRSVLRTTLLTPLIGSYPLLQNPAFANAYSDSELSSVLLLLRAQEATSQELNLLRSGKYKNLQRANVKLAVRFILTNYALQTNFAKVRVIMR